MREKRKGYLRLPKEVALPQEEINSLGDKEFSIGEVVDSFGGEVKTLVKGLDASIEVGGASNLAKLSAIKGSINKKQSENWVLPQETRETALINYKKNVEDEEHYKEVWSVAKENVEEIYQQVNGLLFKGAYRIGTGMLMDYSDAFNLNAMIGINALTQGLGGAVYGASKTTLLFVDIGMGAIEEANLNFQTQAFMQEKGKINWNEVGLSFIYGAIGETAFPILGSAMGMGYGKVMTKLGKEGIEEISKRVIKEVSSEAKMNLIKSKIKNEVRYAKGDFDINIMQDASIIENNINNVGALTGNLNKEGDSIVTVNGESLSKFNKEKAVLDNIEAELQKITGSKTLIEEDALLKSIQTGGRIEVELRGKPTGKERVVKGKGEFDLQLFRKDQKVDERVRKLFEGKKESTIEELRKSRKEMIEQGEKDVFEEEGALAVNDIGVDNAKATSELFTPKKLGKKRKFGETIPTDTIEEIEKEVVLSQTRSGEVVTALDTMDELGNLTDVEKINDFIDDYGLEDRIPLVELNVDGTVDFKGKTKEQYVSDFKVELQLFSDPIDKTTPEAIFKNITMRKSTKLVTSDKDILKVLMKKSKEILGRQLTIPEKDIVIRNFIKENLYNSYKNSSNKSMTRLHFSTGAIIDGHRFGAREILNRMEVDGDTGFLGKILFDGNIETKTKETGLAMKQFAKKFDDSIRLYVDGNFKTDYDNVHNSLLFDKKRLYYDSLDESVAKRITNENKELDFSKMTLEEKAEIDVFAFDVFQKKNVDLFPKKVAKIIWDNTVGHGKSASQLEGTVLHQMGDLQKFADEKIIDKSTLKRLVDRYRVTDRVLYNRMVRASSNANGLYSTFGYKPKNAMNRMFGNYSKSNPLVKKSNWLFGEGSQAWTLKTETNNFANMIFADEIGRTQGKIPFTMQRYFNYKAKMDSILLGLTEIPVEIATHVAKRLMVGKEPIHKILFQTVDSVLKMHSLTKKIELETSNTFLKENIGALGSYYEFMISKGDTDYSGAVADTLKGMTNKELTLFKVDRFVSRLNRIRQNDLYGDKLALFGASFDIDKFGKIGYRELMTKNKHHYLASKLDEFGIGEHTFNLMVNAKRGEFGIRDYGQYTKKELELGGGDASLELQKMQDFTMFYASKIGFTKPDVEFAKAKNIYHSNDDRFLSALMMYWKKTMYTKLKDGASLVGTMNTYAGLGKTFDWVNLDHYTRLLMSATGIALGGYTSNKLDELAYGYEIEEADNIVEYAELIFNQYGGYTLMDQTSIMRGLKQVATGKTLKAKTKGLIKLGTPAKVVREIERVIED